MKQNNTNTALATDARAVIIPVKDIPGFEGLYAATEDGRIYSFKRKKFLKACGEAGNYQIVCICNKCYYVHRLVAMAWIPNPNNYPEINHIDKVKDHNWASNLEWCTKYYNLAYSFKRRYKPVRCIELNKEYPSITQAAKAHGGHPTNLLECLNAGAHRTFKGYHWEYVK